MLIFNYIGREITQTYGRIRLKVDVKPTPLNFTAEFELNMLEVIVFTDDVHRLTAPPFWPATFEVKLQKLMVLTVPEPE